MTTTRIAAIIDGPETVELSVEYELIGDRGRPWVITPGGRFSMDYPDVRETAQALADRGNRVLIWDRPNCGASDVCFVGSSESAMQADVLAALLPHLGLAPAVITGGSGGARVSLIAGSRHPEVASGLAVWWISGEPYGLMHLGVSYCGASLTAVWNGGMEAVVALPESTLFNWQDVMRRNPYNRARLLAQDPKEFLTTMQRWIMAFCPCGHATVPGLPDEDARRIQLPTLVLQSGASDPIHTRKTSEDVARMLPHSSLIAPPWGDREAVDSLPTRRFEKWPLLAPILHEWATETLPDGTD
jgi:pimeloyl-ACP methyl ester carboxylesterase